MWRHAHHRKGRLSLPAIRISAAADLGSSNGSPATAGHGDQQLSASQPALDNLRSHDYLATDGSQGETGFRTNYHGESIGGTLARANQLDKPGGAAHLNSSSAHSRGGQQRLPPFLDSRSNSASRQEYNQNELFRSLRGDPQYTHEPVEGTRHMALEPFLPDELVEAIQTSIRNCTEYERQCAQLEHSIEHKILTWTHILERYEGQDSTATELREIIGIAQTALQRAEPTVTSAEEVAASAETALDKHERMLSKAKEQIERSRKIMVALEERMKAEEGVQKNMETWKHAMLGTGASLVLFLAVLLAWLLR